MFDFDSMSVDDLESAVRYHNWKYWVENQPEIPDWEYDRLVEALKKLRPDSPVLAAIGPAGASLEAPAVEVTGEKVVHGRPMLSLDKCYTHAELLKWFEKFEGDAVASPKVDGVAASIRYDEGGNLVLAATRGDGLVGELITGNMREVGDVPASLPNGPVEVRGEVYMPLSVFRTRFAGEFANPRNLAAGALKQKDARRTAEYAVRFMAYDIELPERLAPGTEVEKATLLKNLGFNPVELVLATPESLEATYQAFLVRRDAFDFETDGVVFKANRLSEHLRLGHTAHHPRYAIAYKFQGDSSASILTDVEWSVSRTGAINPVGIVQPVVLSGATVARATLHNLGIMASLGGERPLTLGSTVLMMRRGGVIPHVEQVLESGDREVKIPESCPVCGGPTFRQDGFLFAHHTTTCAGTRLGSLQHYLKVVGVRGFGPKLLAQLIEQNRVDEPADLYRLGVQDLTTLERVGEKLALKLVDELAEKREMPLDRFLTALGIPELGIHVAGLLAQHYDGIDAILGAGVEELTRIKGVGQAIAESASSGLKAREPSIRRLLEVVSLKEREPAQPVAQGVRLAGANILFTGELQSMTRSQAQEAVRALGGQTPGSVSRTLTHLVLGDADLERFRSGWRSSKLAKVEALNQGGASIEIIGELAFLGLIGRTP